MTSCWNRSSITCSTRLCTTDRTPLSALWSLLRRRHPALLQIFSSSRLRLFSSWQTSSFVQSRRHSRYDGVSKEDDRLREAQFLGQWLPPHRTRVRSCRLSPHPRPILVHHEGVVLRLVERQVVGGAQGSFEDQHRWKNVRMWTQRAFHDVSRLALLKRTWWP